MHAHELHDKIVNTKFDRSWSGTALEYISELLRDVRRYNALVPRENKLTDEMIRATLERNVEAARPLNAVKERELFDVAKGAPKLALNQCTNLLKAAATIVDSRRKTRPSRQGNTHEIKDNDDDDESCLLYTSPSPRDLSTSRMPSSA